MKIFKFSPQNYFGSNSYVVISEGSAAIIDPSVDYSSVIRELSSEKPRFKYIILTHVHFDHMHKLDEWKEQTGAEVLLGKGDVQALTDSTKNAYKLFYGIDGGYYGPYKTLSGGDEITLGAEKIKVLETPGHTEGSITLITSVGAFVGDLVFAGGGIGRYDLPGGNYSALMHSLYKISLLKDETVIFSGHGEESSVSEIKGKKR